MPNILDKIPANDPLNDPEKKRLIDEILEANKNLPGATMVALNELQSQIGFVSEPMQQYVAQKLRVPVSQVHGVISFYSFFTTQPRGKHTIKFCLGTACYVGGVPQLMEKAKQLLGIEAGQTTPDGNITLEVCRCVGACSQAPVIVVDEHVHGRVKPNKFPQLVRSVQEPEA
ncbi:MAG TPA: NAD(P)H-dependent oxidoreductase subunit E [Anaerolineaceae bacterium]|nr:NAD(P)H-dependent oxidoreductase subunit E [Anaerolineaceae bacterium]HNS38129.1 NAD(P)H-dependent oxidoreductase subunit E [Anaerolineaceae bacterium]HNZ14277.1 NAD(P)H-dependent oxidoreductase subunit E [Anaerolineaceae bacterium]HOD03809.1 NAD(P)H-dependent oxidoreductase subunit E [Anaerolineaceae bacterium]HQF61153.1 NAD(P)H-dependent oxidoreductase subunit E [Anaerolineaceae bacterium]